MTTAELGKIFVERGIKLAELPESEFDCLIGEGTGGAVLFGTTGGVMEAALRTVYEQVRWMQLRQGRQLACADCLLLCVTLAFCAAARHSAGCAASPRLPLADCCHPSCDHRCCCRVRRSLVSPWAALCLRRLVAWTA